MSALPADQEWLVKEWTQRLDQVIEMMTGESPSCTFSEGDADASPDIFWWEQNLSLSSSARVWVGATTTSWRHIGGIVLKAAGVSDAEAENPKTTYQEVLNQSLAGLAQALAGRLRREVECTEGREASPTPEESIAYNVVLKVADQEYPIRAVFSADLLKALNKEPAKPPEKSVTPVERAPEVKPEPSGPPKSIDLLLDVELPVSISFGRAQLPLKDVIKLTTGSIVELNRAVSEPVEIIVNNCVIARGQVVVVEGNFGVRINQVISRQERLRTLN
jgi:flagellar motor switch protein FliN/FliY